MHFVIAVMYMCIRVNIPSIYIVGAIFFLLFFYAFYSCVLFPFSFALVLFRHSPFDKSTRGYPKSSGLQRCSIKIAIYLMKMRRCCWRCCCRCRTVRTRKGFYSCCHVSMLVDALKRLKNVINFNNALGWAIGKVVLT